MLHRVKNVSMELNGGKVVKGDLEMYVTTEEYGSVLNITVKNSRYICLYEYIRLNDSDLKKLTSNNLFYYLFSADYEKWSEDIKVLIVEKESIRLISGSDFIRISLNGKIDNCNFREGFTKVFENTLNQRYWESEYELLAKKRAEKKRGITTSYDTIEYTF